jgi:hypothetical protein
MLFNDEFHIVIDENVIEGHISFSGLVNIKLLEELVIGYCI